MKLPLLLCSRKKVGVIQFVGKSCWFCFQNISWICLLLSIIVWGTIMSCLTYCNILLTNSLLSLVISCNLFSIQEQEWSFQHKPDHVTPLLKILKWLDTSLWIKYKNLTLAYKILQSGACIPLSPYSYHSFTATRASFQFLQHMVGFVHTVPS